MAGTKPLTDGETAILARLDKGPLDLYWGRSGWVPCALPRRAKRVDFDSLIKRGFVKVAAAQLVKSVQ